MISPARCESHQLLLVNRTFAILASFLYFSSQSSLVVVTVLLHDTLTSWTSLPLWCMQIEARVKDKTPYVVVALQEAARMNTLLTEMRQSMEELLLGLGGSLNMSDKMEKLATGKLHSHHFALWQEATNRP